MSIEDFDSSIWLNGTVSDEESDPESLPALLSTLAKGDAYEQDCAWMGVEARHEPLIPQILTHVVDMVESPTVANKGYLLRILGTCLSGSGEETTESIRTVLTPSEMPSGIIARAIDLARKCLHHPDGSVRAEAASALRQLLGAEAISDLEARLQSESDPVAIVAYIETLVRLNAQQSLPLITTFMDSNDFEVRANAVIAVCKLSSAGPSKDVLDRLIENTIVASETQHKRILVACLGCICTLDPSAVEYIVNTWIDRLESIRRDRYVDSVHHLLLAAFPGVDSSYVLEVERLVPHQWLALQFLANDRKVWKTDMMSDEESPVEWQLEQLGLPSNHKDFVAWVNNNQPSNGNRKSLNPE